MENYDHFSFAVSQFWRKPQAKRENNFEDVLILLPIHLN